MDAQILFQILKVLTTFRPDFAFFALNNSCIHCNKCGEKIVYSPHKAQRMMNIYKRSDWPHFAWGQENIEALLAGGSQPAGQAAGKDGCARVFAKN